MSAIAGILNTRSGAAACQMKGMLEALEPWGRDNGNAWSDGEIAFGWRQTVLYREDFFDTQPVVGGEGRFHLVFDGRLDNREELAHALSLPRESAREWPDSRYVLACWEKWLDESPRRLLGDFAFAVWDSQERELFLARDQTGSRPLAWCRKNGIFAFATTPVALFSLPHIQRRVREDAIAAFLRVEIPEAEDTLFEGVFRLPGGHAMRVTAASERSWPYWRLEDTADIRYPNDDDYVEALRERYSRTVRARLRTMHPIGSHLSGGLDSSGVTVFAANLLLRENRTLTAFTAVPAPGSSQPTDLRGRIADEGLTASKTAAMYPNIGHVLVANPTAINLEDYDRIANCFGMPISAVLNLGWWERTFLDARSRGIRVMLVGVRGNLTLSRNGSELLAELLRDGRLPELVRELKCARRRGVSYRGMAYLVAGELLSPDGYRLLMAAIGRSDGVLSLLRPEVSGSRKKGFARREQLAIMCRRGNDWTIGHSLAAWDIDARDPTSARPIMEFCYAIPPEQYYFRGQPRRLMRRLLTGIVPSEVSVGSARGLQSSDWRTPAWNSWNGISAEVTKLAKNRQLDRIIDYRHMLSVTGKSFEKISREEFQTILAGIVADRFARR